MYFLQSARVSLVSLDRVWLCAAEGITRYFLHLPTCAIARFLWTRSYHDVRHKPAKDLDRDDGESSIALEDV